MKKNKALSVGRSDHRMRLWHEFRDTLMGPFFKLPEQLAEQKSTELVHLCTLLNPRKIPPLPELIAQISKIVS